MTVRQAVKSALSLLTVRDRRLLGLSVAIQMATSFLDLVGVLLIGLVGALSVTTIQSQPPPPTVTTIASVFGGESFTSQELVLIFAAAAAAVLLTKSVASSLLTRRVLVFLANRQALVSARLSKALLAQPLTFIQQRTSQESAYALISGAGAATSQILGQLVIGATEVALLAILATALLLISPWPAIGAIAFFTLVGLALQRAMGGWAARAGTAAAKADIDSLNTVQEAISAYREISVSDRRELYVERIQSLRWKAASVSADTQFIGMFPKYMFEAALVVGGFSLAAVLFATQDSATAVGTLALFLAAGTRVMPSLLRLQGATLIMRAAAGAAEPTFRLAADLHHPVEPPAESTAAATIRARIQAGNPTFSPEIQLTHVTVQYLGAPHPTLANVSLRVQAGMSMGLVGRSGVGKSTLADVLLGILEPNSGSAMLGGVPATEATRIWPGAVSYVPQEIAIASGTIRSNVALGLPDDAIDDELIWEALHRAHLAEYVEAQPGRLLLDVGEAGVRLSGGQRQRLGIARALYTRPRLLVLDEATSALDAETEELIGIMIRELEGDVTTVVIAHRLSTVQHVDIIAYIHEGRIIAQGTFSELLDQVPAFQQQARLMGFRS